MTTLTKASDSHESPPEPMSDREIQARYDALSDDWHELSGDCRANWCFNDVTCGLAYSLVNGALTDDEKYEVTCALRAELDRAKADYIAWRIKNG